MKFGYARVSSSEQNENRQIDALLACGIELRNIYIDKQSGKNFEREQYQLLMRILREGDSLIVTSLDRFGRNYEMIKQEYQRITNMRVLIEILDMPLLSSSITNQVGLTGKFITDLVLSILSYVAENERRSINNRQKEGIFSAKKRGVKFGRPTKCSAKVKNFIIDSRKSKLKVADVCSILKISKRTYYNYLNAKH